MNQDCFKLFAAKEEIIQFHKFGLLFMGSYLFTHCRSYIPDHIA